MRKAKILGRALQFGALRDSAPRASFPALPDTLLNSFPWSPPLIGLNVNSNLAFPPTSIPIFASVFAELPRASRNSFVAVHAKFSFAATVKNGQRKNKPVIFWIWSPCGANVSTTLPRMARISRLPTCKTAKLMKPITTRAISSTC